MLSMIHFTVIHALHGAANAFPANDPPGQGAGVLPRIPAASRVREEA